ncbi:hypothetical protein QTP70_001749 [Hemibagrus guttatus]|uniref:Reverse transcriptase n=1 Tax=Hemibagrus guttatus TaxID=175788 RepID=A0AAE0V6F8_9TELE|nr:hypothetical protein QTP70_001749 [Hemibagrus guttatus]
METLGKAEVDVRQELSRCKIGKAMGPDGIPARVLKLCAMELSPVFYSIMHESYSTARWPTLWKNSTIIPLPKKPCPLELNHYRPVALTPIASKCYEKLILRTILSTVNPQLDKDQFAYKASRQTYPSLPKPEALDEPGGPAAADGENTGSGKESEWWGIKLFICSLNVLSDEIIV